MLKSSFQSLFIYYFPPFLVDRYQLTNITTISQFPFFYKIQITKVIWTVNNIFWTLRLKFTPLAKEVIFYWWCFIDICTYSFYEIYCQILMKWNYSLSHLYLGHNNEAIIFYPYLIWEWIEPFLLKPFIFLCNLLP